MKILRFYGIDGWNRPIFKALDEPLFFGSTNKLFCGEVSRADVLDRISEHDLSYFGDTFDCEPDGSPAKHIIIECQKGDQIMYIPDHAKGDVFHEDNELGFITSIRPDGEGAFCRYWNKKNKDTLRTTANSESTNFMNIIHWKSHEQDVIDNLIECIEGGEDVSG